MSKPLLSRRVFLIGVTAVPAVVAVAAVALSHSVDSDEQVSPLLADLGLGPELNDEVLRLGRAVIEVAPDSLDSAISVIADGPAALVRNRVVAASREDARMARVVEVDGWQIPTVLAGLAGLTVVGGTGIAQKSQ